MGEAWWHGRRVFFGFGEEDGELFDGGHGEITSIVAGEEGLRAQGQISFRVSWSRPPPEQVRNPGTEAGAAAGAPEAGRRTHLALEV